VGGEAVGERLRGEGKRPVVLSPMFRRDGSFERRNTRRNKKSERACGGDVEKEKCKDKAHVGGRGAVAAGSDLLWGGC
jgi:hypothetical protein